MMAGLQQPQIFYFLSPLPPWGPAADLAEMLWNCFHVRRLNTLPFHQAIFWKGAFWVVALSNMSAAADHSVRSHFNSRTSNKLKTKLCECFHCISSENPTCGRLSLMCIDKSGLAVESCGGGCCTVRGAELFLKVLCEYNPPVHVSCLKLGHHSVTKLNWQLPLAS